MTQQPPANQLDPSKIMQIGTGFFASKVLLVAVKLELFTHLGSGALSSGEIQERLNLHPRAVYDFLDTLVALGFLQREGYKESATYSNAAETDFFLDKNKKSYMGGIIEMANDRLYGFWGDLEEALHTGQPQNELKHSDKPIFEELYASPERLEQFLVAMSGAQMGGFQAFAQKFDFSPYKTLCDMGGASGAFSAVVAQHNAHMHCVSFDLPPVAPIATKTIAAMGASDRVEVAVGDFFEEDFPKADIITMGNILHDWNLEKKKLLIRKAYEALPSGGALIAIENIIDDERRHNVFGLLMSLNMLIEIGDGFDYTGADFTEWATEAGFSRVEVMPLAGPTSAAIAYK